MRTVLVREDEHGDRAPVEGGGSRKCRDQLPLNGNELERDCLPVGV
jgi:hypothetical protein